MRKERSISKNIIVCTDGTWDHPDSKTPNVGTTPDETNVFKFFDLLPGEAQIRPAGVRVKSIQGQTAFYDDGVGADGIWRCESPKGRREPVWSSSYKLDIDS